MKLILDGNINSYYIQTLCMIFFPGEKFGVAEQLDPNNVLAEYPRPQLERGEWLNLNGLWDYAVTDLSVAKPATAAIASLEISISP